MTIPQELRDTLGLSAGGRVEFLPAGSGQWLMRAVNEPGTTDEAGGVAAVGHGVPGPVSDDIDQAIAAGFAGVPQTAYVERGRDD